MFASFGMRLLAGAAAALIIFCAAFGAAWKVKDGIEAREALASGAPFRKPNARLRSR